MRRLLSASIKGRSDDSFAEYESRPSGRALKARRVTPPIGAGHAHAATQPLQKNILALAGSQKKILALVGNQKNILALVGNQKTSSLLAGSQKNILAPAVRFTLAVGSLVKQLIH